MVSAHKVKILLETKSRSVTTWAFHVTNNASITLSKVNSTHPEYEQLKCVLCYLIVACVEFKRGMINYMATNGIPTFQKHLKLSHQGI
jgi:hypothetical protein